VLETFQTVLLTILLEFPFLFQSRICGYWSYHNQAKSWRLLWSTASHHSEVKCKGEFTWEKIV